MTTIQLLIADEGNRNALHSLLASDYTIERAETVTTADLYLVDDTSLPTYHEELRVRKEEAHPTFCPVVLLRREDTRIDVKTGIDVDSTSVTLVDDVVTAPIEKPVFYRRMNNLLVRRDQSISLTRRYEESEARFQALFDAIPDPAFVLDDEGTLLEVNDAFSRLTSHNRQSILGTSPDERLGLDLPTDSGVNVHDLDGGNAFSEARTIEFSDADDRTRYGKLAVRRVTVAGSEYVIGVLADITELKEKTERLEEFANVVAHDLRNPLQVAQGRLPRLRERHPETGEHLEAMDRSLTRMEDLIDKLLTMARVGQTDADRVNLTLGSVARSAWENVETERANLEVVGGDSLMFRGDRDQVLQLFENLFRNAIDHGGSGVTVHVGTVSDGFYVADDGPGIPPAVRDEILDVGYTTETQGTGLGLNIVTEIVDSHGWELNVREGTRGGARFEIRNVRFGS